MNESLLETRISLILRLTEADDNAAWEDFVELYLPLLNRVARKGGLQPADAENLAQTVMLKVSQNVSSWLERDDRGSFRAWLVRIARNQAIDLFRSNAKWKVTNNSGEGPPQNAVTMENTELARLIDSEYEQAVFVWAASRVRSVVSERTWKAFWMTHVEGIPIARAARELHVRPGNIYFARCRVVSRLRQLVMQYED